MEPPRRRRPPLSCTICRRRKLKCDKSMPCAQCVKSKMPDQCSYASYVSQWRDADAREERLESTPPVATTSSAGNNASLSSGMHVFDSRNRVTKPASRQDEMQELRGRVKALEHVIARQGAPINTPDALGDLSDAGRPDGVAEVVESLPDRCFRGSNGGTRYVGRSNYALFMSLVCLPLVFGEPG